MSGFGRIRPFCDDCQFADWDGVHGHPCACECHVHEIRVRPLAVRAAEWRAR